MEIPVIPTRLYCTACMTTWLGNRHEDDCPKCGRHNFLIFRGGDFGCAIHFEHRDITHEDFTEWKEG